MAAPSWKRLCVSTTDLFKLIYSKFWINFSKDILSDVHTKDVAFRRTDLSSLLGCRFWTRLLGSWKHVSRSQYVLIRTLWEIKVWFLYLKKSSKEWWYMCALCRILHDPIVFDTCYWWTHVSISLVWLCLQESLRAWLTNDRPRMSSYPGSTTYAMIS